MLDEEEEEDEKEDEVYVELEEEESDLLEEDCLRLDRLLQPPLPTDSAPSALV